MHKIKKKKIHVTILRLSAPLLYAQNQKKKKIHVSILRLSAPLLYAQNQKKIHLSIFHRF